MWKCHKLFHHSQTYKRRKEFEQERFLSTFTFICCYICCYDLVSPLSLSCLLKDLKLPHSQRYVKDTYNKNISKVSFIPLDNKYSWELYFLAPYLFLFPHLKGHCRFNRFFPTIIKQFPFVITHFRMITVIHFPIVSDVFFTFPKSSR